MRYEKIILVTRKTRLEGLIERFNTRGQARFYVEHSGGDFDRFEVEHDTYHGSLAQLRQALQVMARLHEIERQFLPNFIFSATDLVVAIGIDGLVVNTAKYLSGQPLIAVNPDPRHIDGVLLPFTVARAPAIVHQALRGQMRVRQVAMARAQLNDGQHLLAFNDLFIGARSHVSARYLLSSQDRREHHSSSGIIVSTGAGATGWLSSLFNMAQGMAEVFAQPAGPWARPSLTWEDERLIYVVREPFISKTSTASLVTGAITRDAPLVIESEMPEAGVIFSDGVESDFLSFNAGAIATIGLAEQKTQLVVG